MTITAADIRWDLPASPDEEARGSLFDLLEAALVEAESYRRLAQVALREFHEVQLQRDVLREQRWLDRRRAREKAAA